MLMRRREILPLSVQIKAVVARDALEQVVVIQAPAVPAFDRA